VALGVPLAFVAQRLAVTFVDNMGAMPIAIAAAAAIAVALLAAAVPARRAARVNPIEALRQE
jgi:ABC-type antimicrobial peptide transport system permease subunit